MPDVITFPTMTEAAGALSDGAHLIGGGTLLMRAVNYGAPEVRRLVRVTDPALRAIRNEGGRVVIGAQATMADILRAREADFLAPAARAVGGPAVRNMATVGGNLYAPHPYGDFATALLALDATVRTGGADVPISEFLANRAQGGPVFSISVARPSGEAFRFRKVSRVKPKGVSVLSIAVLLNRAAGRLSDVRIAFGAMAPTPLRAAAAERALEGASLDAAGISPALAVATDGLSPPDDALASAWYRREVAPVHLRRVLLGEDN